MFTGGRMDCPAHKGHAVPGQSSERYTTVCFGSPYKTGPGEAENSADPMKTGGEIHDSLELVCFKLWKRPFTSPCEESRTAEKASQKPVSDAVSSDSVYSADAKS